MKFTRITVSPDQMAGVPCIRGLRIPVATIVGMVAEGMANADILKAYPDLQAEDIAGPSLRGRRRARTRASPHC